MIFFREREREDLLERSVWWEGGIHLETTVCSCELVLVILLLRVLQPVQDLVALHVISTETLRRGRVACCIAVGVGTGRARERYFHLTVAGVDRLGVALECS